MFNLFTALKKEKIWDFNGGIHPPEMKTQSSHLPLRNLSLPERFIIPLQQHLGPEGELCVKVGDQVLKGQPLTTGSGRTVPVHAPTSGIIAAIEPHITAHPSGLKERCILIETDGEDRWYERQPINDFRQLNADELNTRIHLAGIAGLGGAGFPTGSKLQGGLLCTRTLILNAAECEPYITADDRLMQEHADQIILGTRILCHMLKPERVLIGIEDNKPEAIAAFKVALRAEKNAQNDKQNVRIELRVVPTKYPSGGAKQLTRILTGLEIPKGKHSSAIGVLMQNVGTVFAIKRAIIDGEPLIERVITLTGEAMAKPGNVWARLGTPVSHLMTEGDLQPQGQQKMVIMGGPLMGFTLPSLDVPVVKITNCLLAPSESEVSNQQAEEACIRCSLCADACPASLLPQQLYWFSRGQEHEKARNHNLFDCIECGACAYVCPSNIPLVQYYRQEKAEIRAIDVETTRAAEAKARFEAKQARMEREKQAREEKHKKSAVKLTDDQTTTLNAAISRVAKIERQSNIVIIAGQKPDNSAVIAARESRKAQIREKQAVQQQNTSNHIQVSSTDTATDADPRKAALAAAIARAKARKNAASQESSLSSETVKLETVNNSSTDTSLEKNNAEDSRKASVAAAIARVKAKKASVKQEDKTIETTSPAVTTSQSEQAIESSSAEDKRKAAVAAAIARVKAKKVSVKQEDKLTETIAVPVTTSQAEQTIESASAEDKRKAAVAAAIARVKAKKMQQHDGLNESHEIPESKANGSENNKGSDSGVTPLAPLEIDPRKTAVAAAIARVKARKAAQAEAAKIETIQTQVKTAQAQVETAKTMSDEE